MLINPVPLELPLIQQRKNNPLLGTEMGLPGPQSPWPTEFTYSDLYFGCSFRKLHLLNHLNERVGCSACPFLFVQHESALCGLDNTYWSSQRLQLSAGGRRDQQEMQEGKQRKWGISSCLHSPLRPSFSGMTGLLQGPLS